MPTTVLTSNWAEYFSGPWIAYNNVWGAGGLVNGVDFTQTITIDEATFPDGTVLSWSWPSAYKYYAYPEIIYGSAPGLINPDGPQSAQTADFTSLSTSYSITLSGNTNNYDVIFDLWFTPTKRRPGYRRLRAYGCGVCSSRLGSGVIRKSRLHADRLNSDGCQRLSKL